MKNILISGVKISFLADFFLQRFFMLTELVAVFPKILDTAKYPDDLLPLTKPTALGV